MAVADKKPPKKTTTRTTQTREKVKETPEEKTEGAWKYENGKKVRNGRLLPGETKLKQILYDLGDSISNGDAFVGEAIKVQSPELAYGYCRLAQEDATVKRIIGYLTSSSAYADALIPTAVLAVAILWHFGIFVPDKLGIPAAIMTVGIPMSREVENEFKAKSEQAEQMPGGPPTGGSGTAKAKEEAAEKDTPEA